MYPSDIVAWPYQRHVGACLEAPQRYCTMGIFLVDMLETTNLVLGQVIIVQLGWMFQIIINVRHVLYSSASVLHATIPTTSINIHRRLQSRGLEFTLQHCPAFQGI